MRGPSSDRPAGHAGRGTRYSAAATLAAAAVVSAVVVGTVLALAMPAVGVVALAATLAATTVARRVRPAVEARRRERETRTVCVPHTGVCVEA